MASDAATGRLKRDNNGQAVDATGLAYDKIQASKNQPSTIISDVSIGHTIEEIRTKRCGPLVMAGGWVIPESARRAVWLDGWNSGWSAGYEACVEAVAAIEADAERAEATSGGDATS